MNVLVVSYERSHSVADALAAEGYTVLGPVQHPAEYFDGRIERIFEIERIVVDPSFLSFIDGPQILDWLAVVFPEVFLYVGPGVLLRVERESSGDI
jgi:hypothetical protein